MTREIPREAPLNSNVTRLVTPHGEGTRRASDQDFSALMRTKQQTDRSVGFLQTFSLRLGSFLGAELGGQAGKGPTCPETNAPHRVGAVRVALEGAVDGSEPRGARSRRDGPSIDPSVPLCSEPLVRMFARPVGGTLPETTAPPMPNTWAAEVLRVVKRVAWGGDRDRGTAHIEFGEGPLAGAAVTIESHRGLVSLVLDLPTGVQAEEWERRLAERLARRGLVVDRLLVR